MAKIGLTCLLILLFQSACTEQTHNKIDFSGSTMGTHYHISLIVPPSSSVQTSLKNGVDELLVDINQQMSTYISDSQISQFNRYKKTDWFPVSDDFMEVISTAQTISKTTNGAFDITIAPLVNLWGFGPEIQFKIPSKEQLQEVMKHIGYEKIIIKNNPPAIRKTDALTQIDLSAIAKGFAVDKISRHLNLKGFNNHLVEIGGEISTSGNNKSGKDWRIIIEKPDNNEKGTKQTLELSNLSVATSGDYRNYFIKKGKRYSHTLNPKTGNPVSHKLASVTVLEQSATMADAYATALLVMGEEPAKIFAQKHNIKIYMFIRNEDGSYRNWNNIDE